MKTTITVDDLCKIMDGMTDHNTFVTVLSFADPEVSEKRVQDILNKVKALDTPESNMTIGQLAAKVIRDEKIECVIEALAMYGYCNYHFAANRYNRADVVMEEALTELAEKLGGSLSVINVKVSRKKKDEPGN